MLNNRSIEILKYLINSEEDKYVEELSDRFKVSKRMIRYDIDSINDFLKSNNLSEIEKKSNSPLKINFSEKNKIIKILDDIDRDVYILSIEERVGIIIYELLNSQKECTYSRLQEILYVSKSTIVSDLKKVKEWLADYNIKMIKYSNKGILVIGDEIDIRRAMTDVLIGSNNYNILKTLEKIYSNENSAILDNVKSLKLSSEIIEYIKRLVIELEEEFGIFTDEDFMSIVFTVFVIITRSKEESTVKYNQFNNLALDYKKEYNAAEKIAINLLEKFGVIINDDDIAYLTSIIVSVSKNAHDFLESKDYFLACSIANTICNNAEELYSKHLLMDTDLYESFINHIKGLVFRLKFRINTKNEIISNIKSAYSQDFCKVKKCCEFLEKKFQCSLSDDEVGFITLYICAAINRNKEKKIPKVKNILIVCSQGFATGRILESKIRSNFEVNIIAVTSVHAIDKYIKSENIDLIISTLNIEKKYNVKNIVVSPIFNDYDIELLKGYIKYSPQNNNIIIPKDIMGIIDKNCIVKDKNKLMNELNDYFNVKNNQIINRYSEISLDKIQLNLKCCNWIDAIRLGSRPLLDSEMITEGYIDAMIKNVEKYGGYIVVDDGIAIPHAKSENMVKKSGFTINTFIDPIEIGEHTDIRILFILAVADEEKKVDLITKIMGLIEDEVFISFLLRADDKKKVYDYINEKSRV
ncbi:BglG family transcription antiterminator [Clostridium sp. K04]|uniref:BglG family transcription antiterminator n=1 Tax=Clostridium sp. K04 TaxID=2718929 RepID=UPI001C8B0BCA|nr:BglG family transcription antiterminator [Clostridium sp. K04]MBX9184554.1 transcription antiterminator [Clostridium sp. K04]